MTTPNTTPNANPNAKTVIAKPITAENGEVSFKLNINPQDISSVEAVYLDLVLTTTSGEKILLPNAALLGATANVICNLIFQNGHKISAADELQQVGIQQPVDGASFRLSSVQNPVDSEQINGRDFGLNNSNQEQSSQLQNQAEQVAQLLKSLDAATQSNSTTTSTSSASGPGFSLATSKSPTVNVLASASPGAPPSPKNANTSSGTANINDSARSLNGGETVQISGTEMSPPANGTIIGVNMGGNVSSPNATGFSDVASSNMRSGSPLTIAAANTGAITTNTDTWGTTVHNTLVMPGVSSSANVTVTLTLINTSATGSSLAYSTVQALQAIGFQINQQAITASTTSISVSASSLSNLNFDLSWTAQSSTSVNQLAITALKQFQFGVQYQYTDALGVVHSIKGNPVTFTYDTSATATTAKDSNGNAIFDLSATGMSYKIIANDQGSQITTGYGDDTIISSQAANTITGGQGNNTISYEKISGDVIVKLADSGSGTGVKTTSSGSTTDQLNNIVNIIGSASGNDTLQGNSQNNIIVGGGGNNTFVGSHGSDAIFGSTVSGSVNTADYSTFTNSMTLSGSTQFATINKGVNSSTASSESDTLSNIQIFDLGSGHNLFAAAAPSNMNVNGGTSGSNSAQYNNVTDALKITLGSNSAGSVTAVVQDGTKSDQLLNFQSYTGSATSNQFVELVSASNANLSLNAGTSQSSIDYSAMSGIHASVSTNQINVTKTGGGVDTLSGIQTIVGSQNSSDQFSIGAVTGLTVNDGHGQNSASYVSETSTPLAFSISNSGTSSNPSITAIVTDGLHSDLLTNISNFTGSGATTAGIDNSFSIHGVNGITVNGGGSTNTASYTTTQDQLSVSLSGSGSTNQLVVTDITTNATDTLANIQSFTGGANGTQYIEDTTAGALNITLNGTNKDAISYAQVNSALNITEVSANGISATVSKSGGGVDSLDGIAQITTGAGNNTVHGTAAGSFTVTGGAGVNTADYSSLSTGVSASFTTTNNGVVASVAKGNGATDTLTNFDSIVGTSGNDTYKETSTISGVTIAGGSGSNTMNDSALSSALTFNITGSSSLVTATVTDGAHTDTLSNVTSFVGGSASNTFNDTGVYGVNVTGTGSHNAENYSAITSGPLSFTINAGSASNTITVNDGVHTDTLSNIQTLTGGNVTSAGIDNSFTVNNVTGIHVNGEGATNTASYANEKDTLNVSISGSGSSVTYNVTDNTTHTTDILTNIQSFTGGANGTTYAEDSSSASANLTINGKSSDVVTYTTPNLNITEVNANNISATINKGNGTDSLEGIYNINAVGSSNDMLHGIASGSFTVTGGSGINTANYTSLSTGMNVSLSNTNNNVTASVAKGNGATDTLTNFDSIVGTSGNDTYKETSAISGVTISGGAGSNTMNDSALSSALTFNITGSSSLVNATVTDGSHTDALSNVTSFVGGSASNTFNDTGVYGVNVTGTGANNSVAYTTTDKLNVAIGSSSGTSSAISVSDTTTASSTTDTLNNIQTITGGSAQNTFAEYTSAASQSLSIVGGGNASTSANYQGFSNGVTITETSVNGASATVCKGMTAGTDTLSGIRIISTNSANDTLIGSTPGNYTLSAGAGANTADYSSVATTTIQANGYGNSIDVNKGSTSDTLSGFNHFVMGVGNDTLAENTNIAGIALNAGTGSNAADYSGITTGTLSFTIGVANGNITSTVTDGTHTDTLTNVQTFTGGHITTAGVDNSFTLNGVNGVTVNGGGATNTASYASTQDALSVSLSGSGSTNQLVVTDISTNATDALINIQSFTGGANGTQYIEDTTAGALNITLNGSTKDAISYAQVSSALNITEVSANGVSTTVSKSGGGVDSLDGIAQITTGTGNNTVHGTAAGSFTIDSATGNNTASYVSLTTGVNATITSSNGNISTSVNKGSGNVDSLNNFQTIIGTSSNDTFQEKMEVSGVTLDGGLGTNTIDYSNISNPTLTFTIGKSNGNISATVTDGTHIDTLSNIQSFIGANSSATGIDNTFNLIGVNTVNITGKGNTNAVSYNTTVSLNLTIGCSTGTSSSITVNASDTLNSIQQISGGSGANAFTEYVSAASQNYTITGGTNGNSTASINYQNFSSGMSITEAHSNGTSITVTKGAGKGIDTLVNIQQFSTSAGNNTLVGSATGAYKVTVANGSSTANYNADTANITINLNGTSGTATINKGNTSDTLTGFSTYLVAGGGNDTLNVASSVAGISVVAGSGNNTASYAGITTGSLAYNVSVVNGTTVTTVTNGNYTDTLTGIQTLIGGNITTAGVVDNNFTINQVAGTNINGGGANNTVRYSNVADMLSVNISANGSSSVFSVTDSVTGKSDQLQNVQNFTGGANGTMYTEVSSASSQNISISGKSVDSLSLSAISNNLTITENGTSATISKGTGTDTINGIYNITAGSGNDQLVGSATGSFTIDGATGNNTASYASLTTGVNATITSSNGNISTSVNKGSSYVDSLKNFQTFIGSQGNDTFSGTTSANITILPGLGSDHITLNNTASSNSNTINYTPLNSDLTINLGNSTQVIKGSGGTDTISGFSTYIVGNGSNTFFADANNNYSITGLGSHNIFSYNNTGKTNSLLVDHISAAFNNTTVVTKYASSAGNSSGHDTLSGMQSIIGSSAGNDTFTGSISNMTITTGLGNDSIGLNGTSNTLSYNNTHIDHIGVVFGNITVATKYVSPTANSSTSDSFSGIQTIMGSSTGNDSFSGSTSNTTIFAGIGSDSISLTGSANTLSYVSLSNNLTIHLGTQAQVTKSGAGTDTVSGVTSYILGSGTNSIQSDSSAAYKITGSALFGTSAVSYDATNNPYATATDHVLINYNNSTDSTAATVTKYLTSTATSGLTDTLASIQAITGTLHGNDIYSVSASGLTITTNLGNDKVTFTSNSSNDIVNFSSNQVSDLISLSGTNHTVSYANSSDALLVTFTPSSSTTNVAKYNGSTLEGTDTITGSSTLVLNSAQDTLIGHSNGTAQTITGGSGSNTFYEDNVSGHGTTSLSGVSLNGASGTSNDFVLDAGQLNSQTTSGAAKLSITGESANTANTLTLTGSTSATIDLTNNTHLSTSHINTLDLTGVSSTNATTLNLNSAMIQSLVSNGNSSALNVKLSSTETYHIALSGTQTDTYNTTSGMVSIYSSATQNSSTMIAQAHITGITNLHG